MRASSGCSPTHRYSFKTGSSNRSTMERKEEPTMSYNFNLSQIGQRMLEDLQLRGRSQRTIETYLRSVRMLEEYCRKPADQITEERVQDYFVCLNRDRKWARPTITIALSGIKFCFEQTLHRQCTHLPLPRLPSDDLLLRIATPGRRTSARYRYRQRPQIHSPPLC